MQYIATRIEVVAFAPRLDFENMLEFIWGSNLEARGKFGGIFLLHLCITFRILVLNELSDLVFTVK